MRRHLILKVGIFLGTYAGGYALGAIHEWWAWVITILGAVVSGMFIAMLEFAVKRETTQSVVGGQAMGTMRG